MTLNKGEGGLAAAIFFGILVLNTLLAGQVHAAVQAPPEPPDWVGDARRVSADGYAELEWEAGAV